MRRIIIAAAVTGSRPTKEMNPAVPYSPKEIAEAAVDCYHAGAAVAHIHVRDPNTGRPEFKIELFKEAVDRIRSKCDMVINLTTSGLRLTGENIIEKRLEPLRLNPDLCSYDIGSVNFRDRPFINPPEWGEIAAKRMREKGVKPEIEVFDTGHIYQALDFAKEGWFEEPLYFQLCMGTKWGIASTPENLLFMKTKLPENALWSVLGVGKSQLPMITMAMIIGGNVRVGFEDNIYLRSGVLAKNNAEMVEMAVNLATNLHCEPATPNEARVMLGIKKA